MSLVVHHTVTSSFDDTLARAAMVRYCLQQNWEYRLGSTYDKIDMFVEKSNGKRIGFELVCNACWT
ncbi:hypothetical protein LCGC14_1076720, partial [marine sediment metagenome]